MSVTSRGVFTVILPVGEKAGTTIILQIQQTSDLVLINESPKSIIIIKLTVAFDQNIHRA